MGQLNGKTQFKFEVSGELKQKVDVIFAAQLCTQVAGMTALLETFVELGEEMSPLLLRQVRGQSRRDLARAILRRMSQ